MVIAIDVGLDTRLADRYVHVEFQRQVLVLEGSAHGDGLASAEEGLHASLDLIAVEFQLGQKVLRLR